MSLKRKKLGNEGEEIASDYLQKIGYKIIDRNYRTHFGEIDILAQDGEYIVLVEVKTKTNLDQGTPEEKVDYFKQNKLKLLAKHILQKYPSKNIRIDVFAIDLSNEMEKLNHIINAVEF